MSAADCRHARLHIGAAPQELPAEIAQHLAGCAECSRFRDETLALDARLRSALEVPLPRFRERAPACAPAGAGRFGGAGAAAGRWRLAAESEAGAGRRNCRARRRTRPVAGTSSRCCPRPISTRSCGRRVCVRHFAAGGLRHGLSVPRPTSCRISSCRPPDGPMTVMLLAHEKVTARTEFSEGGFRGVLLPAGEGSVAVLTRNGAAPDEWPDKSSARCTGNGDSAAAAARQDFRPAAPPSRACSSGSHSRMFSSSR